MAGEVAKEAGKKGIGQTLKDYALKTAGYVAGGAAFSAGAIGIEKAINSEALPNITQNDDFERYERERLNDRDRDREMTEDDIYLWKKENNIDAKIREKFPIPSGENKYERSDRIKMENRMLRQLVQEENDRIYESRYRKDNEFVNEKVKWNQQWNDKEYELQLKAEELRLRELEIEKEQRALSDKVERAQREKEAFENKLKWDKEFKDFLAEKEEQYFYPRSKNGKKIDEFIPESPPVGMLTRNPHQNDAAPGDQIKKFEVWSKFRKEMSKKHDADFMAQSTNGSEWNDDEWWKDNEKERLETLETIEKEVDAEIEREKEQVEIISTSTEKEVEKKENKWENKIKKEREAREKKDREARDKQSREEEREKENLKYMYLALLGILTVVILSIIIACIALCCRRKNEHVVLTQINECPVV